MKVGYTLILFPEVNISIVQLMNCTFKELAKFNAKQLHIVSLLNTTENYESKSEKPVCNGIT